MKKNFRKAIYLIVMIAIPAFAGSYADFFRAIRTDNAPAIAALLNRGFDPNTVDEQGRSGLSLALQEETYRAVEALLQHPGLDVNQPNAAGETPLMLLALKGQVELVEAFIQHGAAVRKEGWTALHYAASSGNLRLVALLLRHGADVNAKAPNGNTPLMMASRYGSEEAAHALLKAGADARAENARGLSAFDFAMASERHALAQEIARSAGSPGVAP